MHEGETYSCCTLFPLVQVLSQWVFLARFLTRQLANNYEYEIYIVLFFPSSDFVPLGFSGKVFNEATINHVNILAFYEASRECV